MNIQELEKILKSMNTTAIRKAIQKKGFRLANPNYVNEFNVPIKDLTNPYIQSVSVEDIVKNRIYTASIHKNIKGYKGLTFIWFMVTRIIKCPDIDLPLLCKLFLYTDASVNEEYEKAQAEIIYCEKCRAIDQRKNFLLFNGKTLCHECFVQELRRHTKETITNQ